MDMNKKVVDKWWYRWKLRGGGTGGVKAFDGGVKRVGRRLSEGGHAKVA